MTEQAQVLQTPDQLVRVLNCREDIAINAAHNNTVIPLDLSIRSSVCTIALPAPQYGWSFRVIVTRGGAHDLIFQGPASSVTYNLNSGNLVASGVDRCVVDSPSGGSTLEVTSDGYQWLITGFAIQVHHIRSSESLSPHSNDLILIHPIANANLHINLPARSITSGGYWRLIVAEQASSSSITIGSPTSDIHYRLLGGNGGSANGVNNVTFTGSPTAGTMYDITSVGASGYFLDACGSNVSVIS